MAVKKIKVYALSTCPWCRKTKQFFKDKGVEFEAFDYDLCQPDLQKAILEEMRKYDAGDSFPFVLIGDEFVQGYDPESYCRILGIEE